MNKEDIKWYLERRNKQSYNEEDLYRSRKLIIDFVSEIIGEERTKREVELLESAGFDITYKSDIITVCGFFFWALVEKLMEDYIREEETPKISRKRMKCPICFGEELSKCSDIKDPGKRFDALNDFCQILQEICWREAKIDLLKGWRRFMK